MENKTNPARQAHTETAVFAPDPALLDRQKQLILRTLKPQLENRKLLHVDVPIHFNIGDLLIDAGTQALAMLCNAKYAGRISLLDAKYLLKKQVDNSTIIALHGGGNFGDIYPLHQQLRLDMIEAFPDNEIIVLPQSVHFDDPASFKRHANLLNRHQNLKIYARDQYSADFLSQEVQPEKVGLLPDLAFLLRPERTTLHASGDTLTFRRKDKESSFDHGAPASSFDWSDLITEHDIRRQKKVKRLLKKSWPWLRARGHTQQLQLRDQLIQRAIEQFSNFKVIDTDRLHGLILAILLGIPAVPRDNNYGKIARYKSTWLEP